MKKLLSGIMIASLALVISQSFAQEALPEEGLEQRTKTCPNGSQVERCVLVDYESYCDPAVQDLC